MENDEGTAADPKPGGAHDTGERLAAGSHVKQAGALSTPAGGDVVRRNVE